MCSVLEVSRSGYYAWGNRKMSKRDQKNESLRTEIKRVFFESKKRYGSPRVHKQLIIEGIVCGRHRIAKLMREQELIARRKRKYRRVLSEQHYRAMAKNILNRAFNVKKPNCYFFRSCCNYHPPDSHPYPPTNPGSNSSFQYPVSSL